MAVTSQNEAPAEARCYFCRKVDVAVEDGKRGSAGGFFEAKLVRKSRSKGGFGRFEQVYKKHAKT